MVVMKSKVMSKVGEENTNSDNIEDAAESDEYQTDEDADDADNCEWRREY